MSDNESGHDLFVLYEEGQRRQHILNSEGRPICGAPADRYRRDDPIPPVGTRVVHERYGPGEIVDHGQQPDLGQWWVKFDTPPVAAIALDRMWVYPYTLRPAVQ